MDRIKIFLLAVVALFTLLSCQSGKDMILDALDTAHETEKEDREKGEK